MLQVSSLCPIPTFTNETAFFKSQQTLKNYKQENRNGKNYRKTKKQEKNIFLFKFKRNKNYKQEVFIKNM